MGSSGEVENMERDEKAVEKSEKDVKLDKWMKPFDLGWRREVVLRLITGSNYCDIYYFHPSGKKLRSLTEVKANCRFFRFCFHLLSFRNDANPGSGFDTTIFQFPI